MMIDHVELIDEAPKDLFEPALKEVQKIDYWESIPQARNYTSDGMVGDKHVFSGCQTIHLRYHKITPGTETSIRAHSQILECEDSRARAWYPRINSLIDWVYMSVKGKRLGRIMLAKMLPQTDIPLHRDPGPYFVTYKRFHVPITTNPMVLFHCKHNDKEIHMEAGNLYQLNNLWLHAAENYSPYERIHVIVDIETEDERFAIEDESEWLKNLPSGNY